MKLSSGYPMFCPINYGMENREPILKKNSISDIRLYTNRGSGRTCIHSRVCFATQKNMTSVVQIRFTTIPIHISRLIVRVFAYIYIYIYLVFKRVRHTVDVFEFILAYIAYSFWEFIISFFRNLCNFFG